MLGGLLIAAILSVSGHGTYARHAAGAMARRLPIVMTYVINFGVPPLLFAQVLYGRALYTSSVLLGAWWIGVVFLLMACYWLLYQFSERIEAGKTAWPAGLASWILAGGIAQILTGNMTLMLRPEAWAAMYERSAVGAHLPSGDPTMMPRFFFMLAGGLMTGGVWMLYLSGRSVFAKEMKGYLSALGGRIAAVAAIAAIGLAFLVVSRQPDAVRSGLANHTLYSISGYAWLALALLILAAAAMAGLGRHQSAFTTLGAPLLTVLAMIAMTLYRDGIRDLSLLQKGFDVWQRTEVSNWSVIGLFLLLFVAGLGVIGWLISVVAKAAKQHEGPGPVIDSGKIMKGAA
ncbi:MAG: hypothetical protein K2X35_11340 [Bryobacteraceae bacterium]|nr:hypothetical protein [Bryobacteraceae bacterium]